MRFSVDKTIMLNIYIPNIVFSYLAILFKLFFLFYKRINQVFMLIFAVQIFQDDFYIIISEIF